MSGVFKYFVDNQYYQYISIGIATLSFVPQTIQAYKSNSLRDVSVYSLLMIFTSSTLWSIYMYETKRIIYFPCTVFLTFNTLLLMYWKFAFYRQKLISSMEKLDNPTSISLST